MKPPELDERWSAQSEVIDNTKNEFDYFNIVLENGEVIEGRMLNPEEEMRDAGNDLDGGKGQDAGVAAKGKT